MQLNFDDMYQLESGASYKKIYRFKKKNQDKILLDFSYNHTDYVSFLEVNNFLSNINISVPKIFDTDDSKSIIMMEDFGDKRYDRLITSANTKEILIYAIQSLIEIQNAQKPTVNNILKQYNLFSFETEIAEFADFYIPLNNISLDITKEFFYIWRQEFKNLNFEWNSFVHKDFEFSNLMYLSKRKEHLKCGILDFQNAFIGFSGWDVFSLLENPRIDHENKYNDELLEYFFNNTNQKIHFKEFLTQYYFLNTARQTRIIGRWINLDKKHKNNDYSKYHEVTLRRLKKSLCNLKNEKLSKLYDKIIVR
jgi:N-acetylmuramate 1-kinase